MEKTKIAVTYRNQQSSALVSLARNHLLAAAILKKEAVKRAATPAPELHHFDQPGPVWGGRERRLLLGLQHYADQILEDGRARGREAGRSPPQRLQRLLCQQRQQTVDLLGQLSGENERQHSLIARQAGRSRSVPVQNVICTIEIL